MYYKTPHDKDATFMDCVITNLDQFEMPPRLPKNVGINTLKLDRIKKQLVPLMPARKRTYWENLATSANAKDLCFNNEN